MKYTQILTKPLICIYNLAIWDVGAQKQESPLTPLANEQSEVLTNKKTLS